MDFDPGAGERRDLRDHGRQRGDADRRPAVGGALERGRHRPRRLPARLRRGTAGSGGRRRRSPGRRRRRQHRRPRNRSRCCSGKTTAAPAVEVQLAIDNCEGPATPAPTVAARASSSSSCRTARGDRDRVPANRPAATSSARRSSATPAPAARSAVGAVRYNNGSAPEPFSSRGPVTHYFGPVDRHRAGAADRSADDRQARPRRHRRRRQHLLRHAAGGGLALLRHLGRGSARGRRRRPGPAGEPGRLGAARSGPPCSTPRCRSAPPVRRRSAPAWSTPSAPWRRWPCRRRSPWSKRRTPLSRNRRPTIEFSANRPVAFSCQVDGGLAQPCASPYALPAPLGDGPHGVAVTGVDRAGREGSSGSVSFQVDTRAPRTRIVKHPRKLIRTKQRSVRRVFRFRSSEPDAVFVCKVDRGLLRFCGPRISRRFGVGKHTLLVKAQDPAGNVDRSPGGLPLPGQAGRLSLRPPGGRVWRRITQWPPEQQHQRVPRPCPGPAGRSARGPRAGCRSRPRSR